MQNVWVKSEKANVFLYSLFHVKIILIFLLISTSFYSPLAIQRKEIPRENENSILISKGQHFLSNFNFDSTTFYIEKFLRSGGISSSKRLKALLILTKKDILTDKIKAAQLKLDLCEDLLENESNNELKAFYWLCKGMIYSYSNSDKALAFLNLAIKSFENETPLIVEAYLWKIDLYIGELDYKKAKALLKDAIYHNQEYQESSIREKVKLLIMKGYLQNRLGNYRSSINIFENEVLPIVKGSREGWRFYFLGEYFKFNSLNYRSLRDFSTSLKMLKDYLVILPEFHVKDHFRFTETYLSASYIYKYLGMYDLSSNYMEIYNELSRDSQNTEEIINNLYQNAMLKMASNHIAEAIKMFSEVINVHQKNNQLKKPIIYVSKYYRSILYSEIGELALARDDINSYIDYQNSVLERSGRSLINAFNTKVTIMTKNNQIREAGELYQRLNDEIDLENSIESNSIHHFYNNFIKFLLQRELYDSSLQVSNRLIILNKDRLLDETEDYSFYKNIATSYFLRGLIKKSISLKTKNISQLISAKKDFKKYLNIRKKQDFKLKSSIDRIRSLSNRIDNVEIGLSMIIDINLLLSGHENINETFEMFQLSKSSQLLETLNRNIAIQQTNIPDSLTLQVNSLKQQSSYLNTQINRLENKKDLLEPDSTRLSDFKSVLLENKVAFNDLMLYLEKTFPKYYEINYNPKIATIEDVQRNLQADEALIEYFVGSDHIYAFTISKDTATVHKLDKVSDSTISQFREVLIPKGMDQDVNLAYSHFVDQSHQLYEQLLSEPLSVLKESKTKITKLYVIPDKSLNYLSFDLLLTEKIAKNSFKGYGKLPYLIRDYNISYGYSASILFREDSTKTDRPFNGNVLAFAPSYEELLTDTVKLNQLGQFRNSLSPLKYNKSEVDGISKYFDTRIFKAGQATERKFVANIAGNDIIHLAMHGLVDSKDSEKSRLVFTPVADSVHDNYLHNFELYNLNIDAKLAVLSACNTGYGKLEGGEGVMSLARAFTYAGTESVVMSQWPADDESSSVIMQYFYKYLSAGKRKDDALRLAKLDYLAEAGPLKQNPFYWNNFVLMGDATPITAGRTYQYVYWLLGLVLLIALGLMAFRYRGSLKAR